MATLQGMVWFISSSVSMIRPLKSFIKIISVSTFWIMKRRRKQLCSVQLLTNFICWLFFRVTGLLRVVSLLWPTSAVLRELNIEFWNRWSVQKEKKQTYSNSGCPFFFFFLVWLSVFKFKVWLRNVLFYSRSVSLNVFRISSSWLSL